MSPLTMFAWEPFAMGFLLVLFRCTSLFMTAPIFGTTTVPMRVRMGVSIIVSLVAYQAAGLPRFPQWQNLMALLGAAGSETLIGLTTGLASRFIIESASAAGHAAGLTMGLGFSATIDPMHGQQSDSLSQMLSFVSVGVAIAAGLHHDVIAWLCRSLIETPPGTAVEISQLSGIIIAEAAHATSLSIRLAFPVMAAVLFGYVGVGLLGRTAPQLNVNNIGFGVALLCGGAAIYYVSPYMAEIVAQEARIIFAQG